MTRCGSFIRDFRAILSESSKNMRTLRHADMWGDGRTLTVGAPSGMPARFTGTVSASHGFRPKACAWRVMNAKQTRRLYKVFFLALALVVLLKGAAIC